MMTITDDDEPKKESSNMAEHDVKCQMRLLGIIERRTRSLSIKMVHKSRRKRYIDTRIILVRT